MTVPKPEPEKRRSENEPPFDPTSWSGALNIMFGLALVLLVVQILNAGNSYRFNRFGIKPRALDGLEGVVLSPFLHGSYGHLLGNLGPFILLGWAILLSGLRPFAMVSGIVIVGGGLLTWFIAPGGQTIVGASALTMGWLGYLIARAVFSRRVLWIAVAVLVFFFFGTLFGSLLPSLDRGVSWQSHVFGCVAGVFAGWLLHPRSPRRLGRDRLGRDRLGRNEGETA